MTNLLPTHFQVNEYLLSLSLTDSKTVLTSILLMISSHYINNTVHSSEIRGLRSTFLSSKTLQNLLYL